MSALPDQSARDRALDIGSSFIVQAPAGSGKTELLTLRFMKLLAVCEEPEQVLAITFTKKAASEMRDRIIAALNWCQQCLDGHSSPRDEFEQLRFDIARTVLAKSQQDQWRLLENPGRLRVQTIDSFCFYLAKQLPILSQVGGNPQVSENIENCFSEAISTTLAYLESGTELGDDIALLLTHLDNNMAQAETLLGGLLKQRDQWINHIFKLDVSGQQGDEDLTSNIEELITETLQLLSDSLAEDEAQLIAVTNFAAENLLREGELDIENYQPQSTLPEPIPESLPYWHLILSCLLTGNTREPGWRKRLTKKEGFPAKTVGNAEFKALNAERKQQLTNLLEKYASKPELLDTLNYLRLLPAPELGESQWRFLGALFRILRLLNGQLYLALRKFKVVDYTQISASAMLSLGDEEQPTDIALALDNVIQHILVDEFQDTSYFQLKLLNSLTRGWEAGDGRSLFLVGDPMQSCYGFRNANVGIYLSVWKRGMENVVMEKLRLTTNFRSQANIVNWVNGVFQQAFPALTDVSRGAVPYSPSAAIHDAVADQGVDIHILDYAEESKDLAAAAEAELILQRIQQLQATNPQDSIAILVRNRSHLTDIVPLLRDAGLSWTASDIDRLNSLPLINDLCSLTRVVVNPGDRLAWLALLRAPWCGLNIRDLHEIANHDEESVSLWPALTDYASIQSLSSHARAVLSDFVPVMQFVLAMRFRSSLRQCVEASWSLLRGLNCCSSELEQESVERFFTLLEEHQSAGGLTDILQFESAVDAAFIPSPAQQEHKAGLFLMTMHKAKGLEYHHVILPGLNRGGRADPKSLLIWHERVNRTGANRLFMAALTETGADDGPLYQLIRHEQKLKNALESTRLMYIAVTRAIKTATLFASIKRTEDGELGMPTRNSLLDKIWPHLTDEHRFHLQPVEDCKVYRQALTPDTTRPPVKQTQIRRFDSPVGLQESELLAMQQQINTLDVGTVSDASLLQGDSELEKLQGIIVHRCLELYVKAEDQRGFLQNLGSLKSHWALQLRHLGLTSAELDASISFIEESVRKTVSNEDLAWIFDDDLDESQCEIALTFNAGAFLKNSVVDRSFIDREGNRWIIDYKTSVPGDPVNVEEFIAEQKQAYQDQLQRYRQLYSELESRPVRTALLLTSIPRLVEL